MKGTAVVIENIKHDKGDTFTPTKLEQATSPSKKGSCALEAMALWLFAERYNLKQDAKGTKDLLSRFATFHGFAHPETFTLADFAKQLEKYPTQIDIQNQLLPVLGHWANDLQDQTNIKAEFSNNALKNLIEIMTTEGVVTAAGIDEEKARNAYNSSNHDLGNSEDVLTCLNALHASANLAEAAALPKAEDKERSIKTKLETAETKGFTEALWNTYDDKRKSDPYFWRTTHDISNLAEALGIQMSYVRRDDASLDAVVQGEIVKAGDATEDSPVMKFSISRGLKIDEASHFYVFLSPGVTTFLKENVEPENLLLKDRKAVADYFTGTSPSPYVPIAPAAAPTPPEPPAPKATAKTEGKSAGHFKTVEIKLLNEAGKKAVTDLKYTADPKEPNKFVSPDKKIYVTDKTIGVKSEDMNAAVAEQMAELNFKIITAQGKDPKKCLVTFDGPPADIALMKAAYAKKGFLTNRPPVSSTATVVGEKTGEEPAPGPKIR